MRAHRAAARLERDGYQVLIVGEQGHPEVEGTLGHAPTGTVVGSAKDLDAVELGKKVGIVVQTTQSEANLRAVVSALVGRVDELRLVDTICEATAGHQGACAKLADDVDVMVVVGGRNSANTTHLAEIAQKNCRRTHHIERDVELDPTWFLDAELIGITAGASTPATQIESVRQRIQTMLES
jgi:4-hydroxy-3-methylbut-2-enyl diphosphate reductase